MVDLKVIRVSVISFEYSYLCSKTADALNERVFGS